MSPKPKLRIFAGPNGSGKSTLYDNIKDLFTTRIFVNGDLLEQQFKGKNYINFQEFFLNVSNDNFQSFCITNGQYLKAKFDTVSWNLNVRENILVSDNADTKIYNSFHFAIVADFIRHELIKQKQSFVFETVFSHPSKLDLIDLAHANGYKVYLYFVGTDSPQINEERVKDRVLKGGHNVKKADIYNRYNRTMDLLLDIIKKCDVTFLWDNSEEKHIYLGKANANDLILETDLPPQWIYNFLIKKL